MGLVYLLRASILADLIDSTTNLIIGKEKEHGIRIKKHHPISNRVGHNQTAQT